MVYCKLPPGIEKFVKEAIESGKYVLNEEKSEKFFNHLSKALGIELKPDLNPSDIKPRKYKTPLSQIIREYRAEKYENIP